MKPALGCLGRIIAFARNNVADASARIFNVTCATGNQVDMNVEDRLAGCLSIVDAEIKAPDVIVCAAEC